MVTNTVYCNCIKTTPLQEQRILNRLQSRSKRLVVAAIDFGTTYSGFAFSLKNTWTKVQCSEWSNGSFLSNKTPTVLLLNPDQTFLAFGYNAETLIAEQKYDSDSEGNEIKKPKYNMSEYYYFQRFKMLLFENEVRLIISAFIKLGTKIKKNHQTHIFYKKCFSV